MPPKKAIPKKKTNTKEKVKVKQEEINFSFNLLTEPWLPVISLKKERQFLNLNDFLRTAHSLERFDFPLPGLETAVIRFLVALVHIVGAPETLKEWEEKLAKGKFEESFIKQLNEKYFSKLDLFSKKEPFMQEANLINSQDEKDGIDRLINFFPYATNQIHWNHKFSENNFNVTSLSPASAVSLLLFSHTTMMAGGSGYKPGINGVPPLMVLLKGKNVFSSILLNVLNGSFVNSLFEQKNLGKNVTDFPAFKKGETSAEKINLQMGFLWKSRDLLLIPEESQPFVCSLSGRSSKILIKKIAFKPQSIFIKKESYWHDPTIIKVDAGSKGIKKLTVQNRDIPAWREYPSLISTKGRNSNKKIFFPPLVIQQISKIQPSRKRPQGNIMILSLATDNKAKIFEINENEYFFHPAFVDNDESIITIENFISNVEQFQWKLNSALKISYKIRPGSNIRPPSFEASYWREIGSNFEESLQRLSYEDDINILSNDWDELLAEHVRKTFYKHTEKLISNPKNLKQYQAGNKFLEKQIQSILLKHKRKPK